MSLEVCELKEFERFGEFGEFESQRVLRNKEEKENSIQRYISINFTKMYFCHFFDITMRSDSKTNVNWSASKNIYLNFRNSFRV